MKNNYFIASIAFIAMSAFVWGCIKADESTSVTVKTASVQTQEVDTKVILDTPIVVELVSGYSEVNFVYASDSASDLSFYLRNHGGPYGTPKSTYDNYSKAKRMFDNGEVFFLSVNDNYNLLEYDDGYAKIQLKTSCFEKRSGDIAWVSRSSIATELSSIK